MAFNYRLRSDGSFAKVGTATTRGSDIGDPFDIRGTLPRARLRLLGTTDVHGTIWPHDYELDRPTPLRGLAALAPLIRAARAEVPATLLLDSGDMLQGTALADLAAEAGDGPHPVIAAMNLLGYDAAAFGNHDFNFGLGLIERALAEAHFPILAANLVRACGASSLEDDRFAPAAVVIERSLGNGAAARPVRVGVIGAAPPQTVLWDAAPLGRAVAARGIVETVAAHAGALRARGADLVVVLCHSGLGGPAAGTDAEDASLAVAALPEVDVVLAGHSHHRHPRPGAASVTGTTKPLVMAGSHGSDLAVIDLDLEPEGAGWRLAAARATLRPVGDGGGASEPAILDLTRPAHASTRAAMDRTVGHSRDRLHGLFPLVGHSPALQFLAEAQLARARHLVEGTPLAGLPLLSAAAPFAAGGGGGPEAFVDIPPGPLRLRHLRQISPFPNRLCVLEITGRVLRAWLERAAAAFRTIAPGAADAPLLDPAAAGYTFDVIFGLDYAIDVSRPPRFAAATGAALAAEGQGRIARLRHCGRPVADADRFALATSSYRAAGGSGYAMIPPDAPRRFAGETLQDTLADFAASRGEIALAPAAVWDFAPIGATAVVDSAPFASLDRHGDPSRRLEPLGPGPKGFARFRLHL